MEKFDSHRWIREVKSGKLNEDPGDIDMDKIFMKGKTKGYQPGDMWSNDFDYVGMLKFSTMMKIPEDPNALLNMAEVLTKLYDSYTDVNYHSEAQDLGIAIDYIEDSKGIEDLEKAQDLLASHQKAAAKTLKDITRK